MTEREWLVAVAGDSVALEDDAVSALAFLAARLVKGQRQYGRLDIASDTRNWKREASEEYADAAVYEALHLLTEARRAAG